MNYIDLFAGVGGFRYGIDQAYSWLENERQTTMGVRSEATEGEHDTRTRLPLPERHSGLPGNSPRPECVYSNEWDKYANSVYRRHYGECDIRDIRTVKSSELPDFDLICGGFPCQSFSVAGKRGGFSDTRGTLFFEIARLAAEKQPRLLLLENVKGLLNHDQGRTFRTILASLDELGYDAQWQVLNSKNFGVPQNRERVILIGHLRGTPRPEVFPLSPINGKALNYVGAIMSEQNQKWLEDGKQFSRNFPQGQRVYDSSGISATLASQSGGLGAKTGLYAVNVEYIDGKREIGLDKVDVANTITATSYKGVNAANRNVVATAKQPDEISNTVRSGGKGSITPKHAWDLVQDTNMQIRRLTPIETERLQGFPDNWTQYGADGEKISDTQRYKMMGNAVTTNVVTAIAERLL